MTSSSCTGSDPHVTRRLYAIMACLVGVLCICAGYLFGRMARNEVRNGNDIISNNLTIAADQLFRKAKRLLPKAVHHNDPEKIKTRILDIFHCYTNDCSTMTNNNIANFIRSTIKYEVNKLIKSIYNASMFIDSLR